MDETTGAVRSMYEQYPYPSGPVVNRIGADVELVLSYGSRRRETSGPYRVLDAGCGRGLGLLGAATLQPEVRFLGVDVSRVSLEDARRQADQRGLKNVAFAEVDLMTLDGLEVPPGGFDVIHSSGVLHHLADPLAALAGLRGVLAPHGVINLMVYGRCGRESLQELAGAVALLFPPEVGLEGRLPAAREVAALARGHALAGTRFEDTAGVDDVEFVDRMLNVNETSYDVPALFDLLEATGLTFLRWLEPADWDPRRVVPDGELRRRLLDLDPRRRFTVLERIFRPAGLELIVAHAGNEPRPPLTAADLSRARFRLHPETVVTKGVRHTPGDIRIETLSFTVRTRKPVTLGAGPAAVAVMLMAERPGARTGTALLSDLKRAGLGSAEAQAVILELLRHEVIFRLP
ncbi:MAG: class I SAM-dependent methyltransferase [Candidatus Krumholzibacteriia bacterium]